MDNIENIVKKLKNDTNTSDYITYREKQVCDKKIIIIYNDTLTSSDKISDFIVRSLDKINTNYKLALQKNQFIKKKLIFL